jgi:outer membrane protein OmpA-like peptidoglycan-associated protein
MESTTSSSGGAGGSATITATTTTKRLFVRRDVPIWPFVWRGLLPLLGLLAVGWYALAPFSRTTIEERVRTEVLSALDLRGHQWVDMKVSGQEVALSGQQPKAGAGDEVLEIARQATCPTWIGRKICATTVSGAFGDPKPVVPVAAAPVVVPPPVVPPKVVEPVAAAKACEADMAALLVNANINFDSGLSTIAASSAGLLDDLAKAAKSCPGVIRIEGHTDNVGNAGANQRLSLARAYAVRDALAERGVLMAQMVAEGFGPSRPKASNATEVGRAANRRIEFKAVAPMSGKS